jgi:adenosylhomocysteine nucleosidase
MKKILIICAMQEELDAVIASFKQPHEIVKVKQFTYYKLIQDKAIVYLVLCGIGKVNAALITQFMLNQVDFDYVFNVGVAGALVANLKLADIVIANSTVEHDVDVTAFDLPLGQIPRMDIFDFKADQYLLAIAIKIQQQIPNINIGRIVSGDQFISDKVKAEFLGNHFTALACDMEAAAIAHVCHVNNVACLIIRCLSDTSGQDEDAFQSFLKLKQIASAHAAEIIPLFLGHL